MTNKIRIAIVGAGLSGLSCAWHLLQHTQIHVDLFDSAGIGGGASGIAAGLLHRYAGRFARANWMGQEGYDETRVLVDAAEKALGKPVSEASGFLRVALSDENKQYYKTCAEKHPDVDWLTAEETVKLVPDIALAPSILIRSAMTIHTESYLEGLWKSCKERGAQFFNKQIESLHSLEDYDRILVTTGAHVREFEELHTLPVTQVKGQLLQLEWPAELTPLPFPISNQVYIVMSPDKKSCIAGSTFEHDFDSPDPDLDYTKAQILPKVAALFPPLQNAKVLSCRAGIRASSPAHHPILKQIDKKCWVLTGMGSKGLLYHGLFGKMAVRQMSL